VDGSPAGQGPAQYLNRSAPSWAGLLTSQDPIERRLGVYALGELGPAAAAQSDALAAAVRDDVSFVRVWAAWALARVAPTSREAVATLAAGMRDDLNFVRSLGAWLLGRLGPDHPDVDDAVPALRELLDDADPSVRAEARVALQRLRPHSTPPG
jgi:HEAT repeat protein